MRNLFATAAFTTLSLMACNLSLAAVSYNWSSDATSYTTGSGTNQVVHLFLNESGATGSAGIASENGLLTVGFSVATSLPGTIVSFTPNATLFPVTDGLSSTSTLARFFGEVPTSATSGVLPTAGKIEVGTITVSTTGNASFTISDYGAGTQTLTFNGASGIDPNIASGAFTVAVPEPTLLGVLAIGGIMAMRRCRR